jgi:hypothetical protein
MRSNFRLLTVDDDRLVVAINIPVVIALLDDDGFITIPVVTLANDFAITIPVTVSVSDGHADANGADTNTNFFRASRHRTANCGRRDNYDC